MNALLGPYKYVLDAIIIAALVGGFAWGVHQYNHHQQAIGEARVQAQWDKEKEDEAEQSRKNKEDVAKKEAELQAIADTSRSQTNAQIQTLNATLASAVAGLRERPSRAGAANLPASAASGAGSDRPYITGAGLSREDSEFLTRDAAKARKLAIQLAQCQTQYNAAAREQVK